MGNRIQTIIVLVVFAFLAFVPLIASATRISTELERALPDIRAVAQRLESDVRHFLFKGYRSSIRFRSAQTALQMLRLSLLDVSPTEPMLWERDRPAEIAPR